MKNGTHQQDGGQRVRRASWEVGKVRGSGPCGFMYEYVYRYDGRSLPKVQFLGSDQVGPSGGGPLAYFESLGNPMMVSNKVPGNRKEALDEIGVIASRDNL